VIGYIVAAIVGGISLVAVAVAKSARSTTPYAFLMAKTRAWEARMLGDPKMVSLAESDSLEAIIAGLRGTDYERGLEGIPAVADQMDLALRLHLATTSREVVRLAPKGAASLVNKFVERLDLGNLKLAVAAVSGEADRETALSRLVPGMVFSKERLEAMIRSENLEELVLQLSETDYYGELKRYLEPGEFEATDLMRAIDHSYFASLWRKARDLGGKNGKVAKELVGREVDLTNVKLLLRLKAAGGSPDVIMKNLIPVEAKLRWELLELCAQADSPGEARSILSRSSLKRVLAPLLSAAGDDLFELERLLDESLLNFAKTLSIFNPLTIATPLAYLYQKVAEVKNLRAVLRGVEDRLAQEERKQLLLRSARIE